MPRKILKDIFGYKEFRSGQLEIIQAVLDNTHTLAVMPTGSGKTRTAIDTVLNWIESLGKSTCSILWIADRDELCDLIGNYPEYLVAKFNSLENRPYTILYGKGLKDPEKTALRWLEYCNIRDQDPEASILREFELVLKVNEDAESEMQTM